MYTAHRTVRVVMFAAIIGLLVPAALIASQSGARGGRHGGTLVIGADVPSAAVWIDGRYSGMAPLSVRLPFGLYSVRVEARGYQEYYRQVDLRSDARIDARLVRTPSHTLRVTASVSSARVFVNGELRGVAPGSFVLPAGSHEIIVQAPGYEPFRDWVHVQSPTRLHASLVPQRATLTLAVPPAFTGNRPSHSAVRIELNGRPVEPGTLTVLPGPQRIRYSSGAFFVEQEIFAEAGRHYHVSPTLELVVR